MNEKKTEPKQGKMSAQTSAAVTKSSPSSPKRQRKVHGSKMVTTSPKKFPAAVGTRKPISTDDFESHLEALGNIQFGSKKQSDESHINMLLTESHANIQEFVQSIPDGAMRPIIEKIPCYRSAKYVRYTL